MGRTRDLANLPQEIAVDGSGNVQINGATGTYRLNIADPSNAFAGFKASSASPMVVGQDSNGDAYVQNNNNATLRFGTNNTERARIDSNGYMYVGCTSNPSASVHGVRIGTNGTNFWISSAGFTSSYQHMLFLNTNGIVGSIATSASATAYNTSSDYRLKENVQPMQNALAKITALKPCTYTWKIDGSAGEGFIAHELAEVVPGCVTGNKDAVDADGNPVYQGIDTSFLVATLVAAIQELKAEVDALKGA